MSHYTTVKTEIKDLTALKLAMKDLNYDLEVDESGSLTCQGYYENQNRKCHARAVFPTRYGRQQHIGFVKQEDGSYEIVADWYGSGVDNKTFTNKLNQKYGYHKVRIEARRKGWGIREKTLTDGTIQLRLRKY